MLDFLVKDHFVVIDLKLMARLTNIVLILDDRVRATRLRVHLSGELTRLRFVRLVSLTVTTHEQRVDIIRVILKLSLCCAANFDRAFEVYL